MIEQLWKRLALWILPATLNVMPRGNVHMWEGRPWTFYGISRSETAAAYEFLREWKP